MRVMRPFHLFAVAAFLLASAPALAQSSSTKPTCAAGDPVVWVNSSSKVYHEQGDQYYGNTKHGKYACKSAAEAAGNHASGQKSKSASPAPKASPASGASAPPGPMSSSKHHHHKSSKMTSSPASSPAPAAAPSPAST
jgi:hypothetical protein